MGLLRRNRKSDVDVESCLANLDRLAAVQASGLLDLTRSDALDALTRQAAERLGTPMAYLNVLDDRHQYHVASFGAPSADRIEPVESSYCQHVVAQDDVVVINDSHDDDLVRDNPATTGGGIRAYLGVPIRRDGHCLGSFCVVDREPRSWTDEDLAVLEELAVQALATPT